MNVYILFCLPDMPIIKTKFLVELYLILEQYLLNIVNCFLCTIDEGMVIITGYK